MADARSAWTSDEFSRIGEADELEIASLRPDGTLRRPRTIWVVRHGDDIYVRSIKQAGLCLVPGGPAAAPGPHRRRGR
jgi:hypothetical protein